MGRVCAASGCTSGSRPSQNKRSQQGLRQLTLFKVPKIAEKRQRWASSLEVKLNEKDFVCELHFLDKDIQRANYFHIGGTIDVLPRERYTLRKEAVPRKEIVEPRELIPYVRMILRENPQNSLNAKKNTEAETSDETTRENDDEVTKPSQKPNIFEARSFIARDTKKSADSHRRMENPVQTDGCYEDEIEREAQESDEQTEESEILTIDKLKTILTEYPLPATWTWAISPITKDEIVLVQVDPLSLQVRLYLHVHNDLSLTIRTADNLGKLKLNTTVITMSGLTEALRKVERTKLCSGSGVGTQSRSENCSALIQNDYRRLVATPRCVHCRKIRKLHLKKVNRKPNDLLSRYARAKQEVFKHQRRYQRVLMEVRRKFLSSTGDKLTSIRAAKFAVELNHDYG